MRIWNGYHYCNFEQFQFDFMAQLEQINPIKHFWERFICALWRGENDTPLTEVNRTWWHSKKHKTYWEMISLLWCERKFFPLWRGENYTPLNRDKNVSPLLNLMVFSENEFISWKGLVILSYKQYPEMRWTVKIFMVDKLRGTSEGQIFLVPRGRRKQLLTPWVEIK